MPNTRILIIEDELLTAAELKQNLEDQGYDVLAVVDNAVDAKRALKVYQLDIVLIDIRLKGDEDGISIARHINEKHGLPIIFISSLIDEATIEQAKVCQPAAYLVKPYNASELFIAMDMALFNFQNGQMANPLKPQQAPEQEHYQPNDYVFIKDKYRFERIALADILWLKAESSYVQIVTREKKYLLTTETLGSFLEKAAYTNLMRVHRSYAINVQHLEGFMGNRLYVGNAEIPVGKSYLKSIQDLLRTF